MLFAVCQETPDADPNMSPPAIILTLPLAALPARNGGGAPERREF